MRQKEERSCYPVPKRELHSSQRMLTTQRDSNSINCFANDWSGVILMAACSIRVLVADDVEFFRRFLTATLRCKPGLQVVCEVADGLEAVAKAKELRPDLVVLDIGLPHLNGIKAARQICECVPHVKILFVSMETCPEIVQETFRIGGSAYVAKADAGTELLAAVSAIFEGRRFVSRGLAGPVFNPAGLQVEYQSALAD